MNNALDASEAAGSVLTAVSDRDWTTAASIGTSWCVKSKRDWTV